MTNDDKTSELLTTQTAQTRARVARDVAQLTEQLTPEHIKERALSAAEHSVESLAFRFLGRLAQAPRALGKRFREHPVASVSLTATAAALLLWRLAARRRRR
jgi:hypothetical protein